MIRVAIAISVIISTAILFMAFDTPTPVTLGFTSGGPNNTAGAPGQGSCVSCHNDFGENSGSATFAITGPSGFTAGDTVPITVSFVGSTMPKHGFEITARSDSGIFVGVWSITDPTNTAGVGSQNVTHTASGTVQTSWTMDWVAPASLTTSAVTFYAAGVDADNAGGANGDYAYTTSTVIPVAVADYPGTGEDLVLESGVNLDPLTGGPVHDIKTATAGDLVTVFTDSPGGTFASKPLLLAAQAFATGSPPAPAFPGIAVNASGAVLVVGGPAGPFGPALLPPGGLAVQFAVPVGFTGFSTIFQPIVIDAGASNGILATADAHEFQIM